MSVRIDLTTLRLFAAIGATLNISKAAQRECIAPSAASQRVSDLETLLGAKLLYRKARGVELSPAGEALRRHAMSILRALEQLEADLGDYAKGVKGHVRMMANPTSVVGALADDLRTFSERYQDISIDLHEDYSPLIAHAVAAGQTDIGIVTPGMSQEGLVEFDYRADELVLIAAARHPLSKRKQVKLQEVLSESFIALESSSAWDTIILGAARTTEGVVRVRFRLKSLDAIVRMVAAGLGIALVSEAVMNTVNSRMGLRVVHLDEDWAKRRLQIVVRDEKALSGPARLMLNHLRSVTGPTSDTQNTTATRRRT